MVSSLFQRTRPAVSTILLIYELNAMVSGRSTSSTSHLGIVTTLLQLVEVIWVSRGVVMVKRRE